MSMSDYAVVTSSLYALYGIHVSSARSRSIYNRLLASIISRLKGASHVSLLSRARDQAVWAEWVEGAREASFFLARIVKAATVYPLCERQLPHAPLDFDPA
jgi:hypothetical protein